MYHETELILFEIGDIMATKNKINHQATTKKDLARGLWTVFFGYFTYLNKSSQKQLTVNLKEL
jgi:hypothetical protein